MDQPSLDFIEAMILEYLNKPEMEELMDWLDHQISEEEEEEENQNSQSSNQLQSRSSGSPTSINLSSLLVRVNSINGDVCQYLYLTIHTGQPINSPMKRERNGKYGRQSPGRNGIASVHSFTS
jgi:hypothetical protein